MPAYAAAEARSRVVKNIRAGEVDVCPGEVDLHVHVIRRPRCVDVEDRLILLVVYKPANAVCVHSVGCGDLPLNMRRAKYGRQVDMIAARREVGDSVEMTSAWLRIHD